MVLIYQKINMSKFQVRIQKYILYKIKFCSSARLRIIIKYWHLNKIFDSIIKFYINLK